MGFNKRKWWHFKGNRSIAIEWSGFKSNPSIYLRVDGDEGEVCFHVAFGIGIWLSFERFIPKQWYPTYMSSYYPGTKLGDEREFSLCFHGGSLWWNFWTSEEKMSYTKNKTWRKGCWHIIDRIKGKHKYERQEKNRQLHILPFFEGTYSVEVIEYLRIDKWPRWPTRKMTTFEVKAGYYEGEVFIEKPIPVEGKGENSWDCGEDGTYSMSFPGSPVHKHIKTTYDASLYFWHSMMKDRQRRGSDQWMPQAFIKEPLKILK